KVSASNENEESEISSDVHVTVLNAPLKLDGEHEAIQYEGNWNLYPEKGAYDDTQKYNNTPKEGDFVQLNFIGTGIDWIGHLNRIDGIANVYIDGEFQDAIDTYGNPQVRQNVNFSVQD